MSVKKGILKSFDSVGYRAMVQLEGSDRVYLEDITVARNIAAAEMVAGRQLAIVFFDDYNPKEAVIVGVFVR